MLLAGVLVVTPALAQSPWKITVIVLTRDVSCCSRRKDYTYFAAAQQGCQVPERCYSILSVS